MDDDATTIAYVTTMTSVPTVVPIPRMEEEDPEDHSYANDGQRLMLSPFPTLRDVLARGVLVVRGLGEERLLVGHGERGGKSDAGQEKEPEGDPELYMGGT